MARNKTRKQPPVELSEETSVLLRILGAVDSLFSPWPVPLGSNSNCGAIFHKRLAYTRSEGLSWLVGGNETQRKHGERVLSTLHEAGFIYLVGRQKGRSVGLTERGDSVARMLAGLPTIHDSFVWANFREIARAVELKRGTGIWILEFQFSPSDPTDNDREQLRAWTAPLVCRDFLHPFVDTVGLQHWTVGKPGKVALQGPVPKPEDDVAMMPEAAEIWQTAYASFRKERDGWRNAPNDVFVPFPSFK